MTNRNALMLAALATVFSTGGVAAQDTEWNRYTLEGLEGVFVGAEAQPACGAFGLSADSVTTAAAGHLAEGPVALLTEEEMLASPALPELRIELTCAPGDNGLSNAVAWSLAVRVQQATQMIRDNQVTLSETVTWYTTDVGVAQTADAGERLGAALAEKLTEFAAAFEAANAEDEDDEGGG